MNVLVTGASGLVGNAVCRWFLKKNHKVTGIVNSKSNSITDDNYTEIMCDLTRNDLVTADTNFNIVIHCAAIIPTIGNEINDDDLIILNQKIDNSVFLYCKLNQLKLIYFSTAYLYSKEIKSKLDETKEINDKLKGYYYSKKLSENYLEKENVIIFRISSPYGDLEKQHNVVKTFAEKLLKNQKIILLGSGSRKQNFIHVDDIAEATYLATTKNISGIYNLTFDKSYSMLKLADLMKNILKSQSEFVFDVNKADVNQNVNFSNQKLATNLNWTPTIDLELGLKKTLIN